MDTPGSSPQRIAAPSPVRAQQQHHSAIAGNGDDLDSFLMVGKSGGVTEKRVVTPASLKKLRAKGETSLYNVRTSIDHTPPLKHEQHKQILRVQSLVLPGSSTSPELRMNAHADGAAEDASAQENEKIVESLYTGAPQQHDAHTRPWFDEEVFPDETCQAGGKGGDARPVCGAVEGTARTAADADSCADHPRLSSFAEQRLAGLYFATRETQLLCDEGAVEDTGTTYRTFETATSMVSFAEASTESRVSGLAEDAAQCCQFKFVEDEEARTRARAKQRNEKNDMLMSLSLYALDNATASAALTRRLAHGIRGERAAFIRSHFFPLLDDLQGHVQACLHCLAPRHVCVAEGWPSRDCARVSFADGDGVLRGMVSIDGWNVESAEFTIAHPRFPRSAPTFTGRITNDGSQTIRQLKSAFAALQQLHAQIQRVAHVAKPFIDDANAVLGSLRGEHENDDGDDESTLAGEPSHELLSTLLEHLYLASDLASYALSLLRGEASDARKSWWFPYTTMRLVQTTPPLPSTLAVEMDIVGGELVVKAKALHVDWNSKARSSNAAEGALLGGALPNVRLQGTLSQVIAVPLNSLRFKAEAPDSIGYDPKKQRRFVTFNNSSFTQPTAGGKKTSFDIPDQRSPPPSTQYGQLPRSASVPSRAGSPQSQAETTHEYGKFLQSVQPRTSDALLSYKFSDSVVSLLASSEIHAVFPRVSGVQMDLVSINKSIRSIRSQIKSLFNY